MRVPPHQYFEELLHHFVCGKCQKKWQFAVFDPNLERDGSVICPHCGHSAGTILSPRDAWHKVEPVLQNEYADKLKSSCAVLRIPGYAAALPANISEVLRLFAIDLGQSRYIIMKDGRLVVQFATKRAADFCEDWLIYFVQPNLIGSPSVPCGNSVQRSSILYYSADIMLDGETLRNVYPTYPIGRASFSPCQVTFSFDQD